MSYCRTLHYCLKVANRKESVDFFTRVLGMMVLRHEEFEGACKATCNGPYDSNWSKTMVGFGDEDDNFVLELTYTYGVNSYEHGNGLQGFMLYIPPGLCAIEAYNYPFKLDGDHKVVTSPCGYTFRITDKVDDIPGPHFTHFKICCTDMEKTMLFWRDMTVSVLNFDKVKRRAVLDLGPGPHLILQEVGQPINHGTAYGRTAFGCPETYLPMVKMGMEEYRHTILNPLVSLETPGKATVQVMLCADPDGHEVAFVGENGFQKLSKIDANGGVLLQQSIKANGGR